MELRQYTLFGSLDGNASDASLATFEAIQHPSGAWEVVDVAVDVDHRRQGLATMLYDRFEADAAATLVPSGWLSMDAYGFLSSRSDGRSVRWHCREPEHGELWLSPKQLLNVSTLLRLSLGHEGKQS